MMYRFITAPALASMLVACSSPSSSTSSHATNGAAPSTRSTRSTDSREDASETPSKAKRGLVCGTRKGKQVITMKIANLERHHSFRDTWVKPEDTTSDRVLLDAPAIAEFAAKHTEVAEGWHDPRVSPFVERDAWSAIMTERLSAARAHVGAGEWLEGDSGAIDDAASVLARAAATDELRVLVDTAQIWCLPTTKGTYKPPIDVDFDRNRCSEIYGGELVRVLATADGASEGERWVLVDAGYALGWISAPSWTPPLGEKEVADFVDAVDSVVSVDDVDWPFGEEHPFQHLRLGTRLPVVDAAPPPAATPGAADAEGAPDAAPRYTVRVPTPTGFETLAVTKEIDRQIALFQYPVTFTRRNVLEVALRRLGDPYGWGGTRGARDCSRLILDMLRVFGIRVGRNSSIQARYGSELIDVTSVDPDAKRSTIRAAAARGVVLLYMPGHIMLYLGADGEEDYVVSAISEYVTPCSSLEDYVNRLDRVAVTPLSIGNGTVRTSFIERITSIQVFGTASVGE
jgi:hypothetical protein